MKRDQAQDALRALRAQLDQMLDPPHPAALARPSFAAINLFQAQLYSLRSTCKRLQVGCVITSADHRYVYGVGYNGNAAGLANHCDSDVPGACGCLHAEENAIINCTVSRGAPKRVYCTDSPCVMCAKRLLNLGSVVEVTYRREYRLTDALLVLKGAGVSTVHAP